MVSKFKLFRTILVIVVRIIVKFLGVAVSLCIIFRVRLLEEISICSLAHPEVSTFQVVGNFLDLGLRGRLGNERISISATSHHGEIGADCVVARLNVLVGSLESRKS